jgi:penicillin-binding protein 1A
MVEEGFISENEAKTAMNEVISIKPRRNYFIEKVPCYTEYVRQYIVKKYGDSTIYNQGLIVHTAVNIEMQKAAQDEITKGLVELDKRQGYRGPAKHLNDAEIETFLQNVKKTLEDDPIEKDKQYKAVIIKINPDRNEAQVKIGNELGVFSMSSIRWSRNAEAVTPDSGVDEKSLRPGDVVLVQVKGLRKKGKDPNDEDLDLSSKKNESKLRVWDLSLQQTPYSEAALLSIEAGTGLVKAMIGGRDFNDSQFNRAIQSKRQPGSSIKPIIYSAALDKGFTPASVIVDAPLVFKDPNSGEEVWKPKNYDGSFNGPTLLRRALQMSMNIVTIKILQDIGIEYVMEYARNLGINSPLQKDLTIALGSSEVSLFELVKAYSVFNNLGELIEPVFITKIEDKYGHVIEDNTPVKKQVIDKSTAYIMTSMLTSVVQGGTASRARGLGRPAAGKTGTTNDLNDAWFVGYTPQLTTGVWVGNDIKVPLGRGETGAKAAIPIWLGFMQKALKNKPVEQFKVPEGVIYADIDSRNGRAASTGSGHAIRECFKEGTGPRPAMSGSEPEEEQPKDETTVMFKEGL